MYLVSVQQQATKLLLLILFKFLSVKDFSCNIEKVMVMKMAVYIIPRQAKYEAKFIVIKSFHCCTTAQWISHKVLAQSHENRKTRKI